MYFIIDTATNIVVVVYMNNIVQQLQLYYKTNAVVDVTGITMVTDTAVDATGGPGDVVSSISVDSRDATTNSAITITDHITTTAADVVDTTGVTLVTDTALDAISTVEDAMRTTLIAAASDATVINAGIIMHLMPLL